MKCYKFIVIASIPSILVTLRTSYFLLTGEMLLSFPCPFRQITEFPCPFCGMTRALVCILDLDFENSVKFSPFALPIILMLGIGFYFLVFQFLKKEEIILPSFLGNALLITIFSNWLIKILFTSPYYW